MHALGVVVDRKEAAAIEQRRQRESLRQERIFNARERLIGVDKIAIGTQTAEKKERQQAEEARDLAYGRESIKNDKLCVLYAQRQERDVRELGKDLNNFRLQNQQIDGRREWDLNDPDSKLKGKPARVSDDDKSLGVSSAQIFDGEDLTGLTRQQIQQRQRREWAAAQKEEKRHREQQDAYTNHQYLQQQIAVCNIVNEMQDLKTSQRRADTYETKEFNLKQAREKEQRKLEAANRDLQDKLTDIRNNVVGPMLTESPEVAKSAFGSHRVLTDRWKGMSPSQVENIRDIQEHQRTENEEIRQHQKNVNDQWDNDRIRQAKTLTLMERSEMRQRREIQKNLVEENKRIAKEQATRLNELDHEVYTNPPTNAYFGQFNTTSR